MAGFSGCNNFFGSYHTSGNAVEFGPVGMIRMACPEEMAVESAFLKALVQAEAFTISADVLRLTSGDKELAVSQTDIVEK